MKCGVAEHIHTNAKEGRWKFQEPGRDFEQPTTMGKYEPKQEFLHELIGHNKY